MAGKGYVNTENNQMASAVSFSHKAATYIHGLTGSQANHVVINSWLSTCPGEIVINFLKTTIKHLWTSNKPQKQAPAKAA